MDQVFPFNLAEKKPTVINPRTGEPGLLELFIATGGAGGVYLFSGTLNQEECEASLNSESPGFSVSANEFNSGDVVWNGTQQSFTLFSPKAAKGHVRIREIC